MTSTYLANSVADSVADSTTISLLIEPKNVQDIANLADSVGLKVSDGSSILSGSTIHRPKIIEPSRSNGF